MKSTTPQRLAQCSTTMRHRQHTVEELDEMVLDAIGKWRAHCRQCATRGCDPFESPGIEVVPFWTDEIREHRDRMRAEGRLSTPTRAKPTEREKIDMNACFGKFGSSYAELAEQYKDVTYGPAQPRPDYRTTRTAKPVFKWPSWLPLTLLGALGLALGYTILHRYV